MINTLLAETTIGKKILINLNNVTCFLYSTDEETIVCYNDDTTSTIKKNFNDLVNILHNNKD